MVLIRNIVTVGLISVMLVACSTTDSQDQSNTGSTTNSRHIYGIDCSGITVDMSVCYDKAKNLCPDGYTVISKQTPTPSSDNSQLMDTYTSNSGTNPDKKGLTIECH